MAEDVVNHPSHYNQYKGFEVIDVCEQLRAPDGSGNYNRGNAFKYLARAGWKKPEKHVEDLQKARFYIEREIARLEGAAIEQVETKVISQYTSWMDALAAGADPEPSVSLTDNRGFILVICDECDFELHIPPESVTEFSCAFGHGPMFVPLSEQNLPEQKPESGLPRDVTVVCPEDMCGEILLPEAGVSKKYYCAAGHGYMILPDRITPFAVKPKTHHITFPKGLSVVGDPWVATWSPSGQYPVAPNKKAPENFSGILQFPKENEKSTVHYSCRKPECAYSFDREWKPSRMGVMEYCKNGHGSMQQYFKTEPIQRAS